MMSDDTDRERSQPPSPDEVRAALLAFSDMIRRLDGDDALLRHLPLLMGRLGDLRHMLFEYEVRVTERLLPIDDPAERESRRIVREALERERDLADEWLERDEQEGGEDDDEADA